MRHDDEARAVLGARARAALTGQLPPRVRGLLAVVGRAAVEAGWCWLGMVGCGSALAHQELSVDREARRGVRELEAHLKASARAPHA